MSTRKKLIGIVFLAMIFGMALPTLIEQAAGILTPIVEAAGGKVNSPTGTAADRYVYYPGTEPIGADEIRLFACGTGMPAARLGQAATCWLVETGNGDKFMFDTGTGPLDGQKRSLG